MIQLFDIWQVHLHVLDIPAFQQTVAPSQNQGGHLFSVLLCFFSVWFFFFFCAIKKPLVFLIGAWCLDELSLEIRFQKFQLSDKPFPGVQAELRRSAEWRTKK